MRQRDPSAATSFLYSGANPIQTDVVSGAIETRRVGVLRGKVLKRDGSRLPGVRVTVLNHPEYGQTFSRADGTFDMAVNGGGTLTVKSQQVDYLTVERQVNVPWQDYVSLPDVVMTAPDPNVTTIDL